MIKQLLRARPADPPPHVLQFQHQGKPAFLQIETASHEVYEDDDHLENRRFAAGHRHDVYHILLYTAGRNTLLLHDHTHPCQRGTLVCTTPQQRHEFRPHEPGSVSYCQVTFSAWCAKQPLRLEMIDLLRSFVQADLPTVRWPAQLNHRQTRELHATLASLFTRGQSQPPLRPMNIALGLAAVLHDIAALVLDQRPPQTDDPLEAARLVIEKQFNEPLSVPELAVLAGCSEGHFHRRFKSRFGLAPGAYQTSLRMQSARNLLVSSDYTLAEIADRLGFGDRYHFSRAFAKQVGTPPGRYRRHFRANQ